MNWQKVLNDKFGPWKYGGDEQAIGFDIANTKYGVLRHRVDYFSIAVWKKGEWKPIKRWIGLREVVIFLGDLTV